MPTHVMPLIVKLLTAAVLLSLLWSRFSPSVCAATHLTGLPVCDDTGDVFNVATNTAAIFGALLALFQGWLWRTWVGRLLQWPIPNLTGTWRGTVMPGVPPAGQPLAPPSEVYLVVRQTAFGFRATLLSVQSASRTVAAEFTQLNGDVELVYSYVNTPLQNIQHRSPVHQGTAVLTMASGRPRSMRGLYFTQRLTRGELLFDARSRELASDIVDARTLPYT
ncbi:hypothetical protein [Deinococcus yunweiensis]|uniref:Cap15 family cyclic dinucleotide receptor domain-containing protein n=1 Tax=Deinococcus yunweiensis TaxID=367282 RepID=UPI00398EE4C8